MNRTRVISLSVTIGGIAVLISGGTAFKSAVLERWYAWKLESGDEEEKSAAAAKLWRIGSTAAVPRKIEELIVDHHRRRAEEGAKLSLRFDGERVRVEMPSVIDIERANGHGSYLSFVRCEVDRDVVQVEKIVWRGRTIRRSEVSGEVRRARVNRRQFERVVEAVRLLPAVALEETRAPATKTMNPDGSVTFTVASHMTSNDFFVLVRLMNARERVEYERRFAGYEASYAQESYLPLLAVSDLAGEVLEDCADWQVVPEAQWRQSHFSDAMLRNQRLMSDRSYWFVMEDSVEAAAWFGNADAIPALRYVREKGDVIERQAKKIDAILSRPDHWLRGGRKELRVPGDEE